MKRKFLLQSRYVEKYVYASFLAFVWLLATEDCNFFFLRPSVVAIHLNLHHISITVAHYDLMISQIMPIWKEYSVTSLFMKVWLLVAYHTFSIFCSVLLLQSWSQIWPVCKLARIALVKSISIFFRFPVWLCLWLDNFEVSAIAAGHSSNSCPCKLFNAVLLIFCQHWMHIYLMLACFRVLVQELVLEFPLLLQLLTDRQVVFWHCCLDWFFLAITWLLRL